MRLVEEERRIVEKPSGEGTEKKERIDRDGEEGEGGWEGKKRGMDQ